ncbi:MAG: DUF4388 domain-containing protein, partial [Anaerolineales bacterium]
QLGEENGTIIHILVKAGRLTDQQARMITTHSPSKGDKEMGLHLINADYLTQQDILTTIRKHILDIVFQLFTWTDGFFRFDPDVLPPDDRITILMDMENVIVEGSRRVEEWDQLDDEIPNLEMALKFVDRPGANIQSIKLNPQEWKVVSYVNPKNSIIKIAKAVKLNELEIRRIVYGLLQAGLVEIVRPEGMPLPAHTPRIRPMTQRENASLIDRIIQRIRSL